VRDTWSWDWLLPLPIPRNRINWMWGLPLLLDSSDEVVRESPASERLY